MLTIWARLSLHESLTEMKSETRAKLKLHALMKEDIILAGRGILVWAIRDSPNAVALVFNADCRPREEG